VKIWAMALLISCCTAQSVSISIDGRYQAERIWEQMIEAKGGRERLCQVETMVIESRTRLEFHSEFRNGEIRNVTAFAFPDREWNWQETGKTDYGRVIAKDLTKGFGYIGFSDGETRQDSDFKGEKTSLEMIQLLYFGETRWIQPKPVRVLRGKGIPRAVDAVETKLGDERFDFLISRTDHLPVSIISYHYNQYTHVFDPTYHDFASFHETDGIQIPGKITSERPLSAGKIQQNIVLNPKLRDDLFTTPPRFMDGPDAWKAP
jgi:hypothetical protein